MLGKLCHVTEYSHSLSIFTVAWVLGNVYISLTTVLVVRCWDRPHIETNFKNTSNSNILHNIDNGFR